MTNDKIPITATEIRRREREYFENHPCLWDKWAEENLDRMIKAMEEMANAPREPMGERQPGERQAGEPRVGPKLPD